MRKRQTHLYVQVMKPAHQVKINTSKFHVKIFIFPYPYEQET